MRRISNSHYHRDHKEPEPVRIRIEPDALYIYNIDGPDRSIRLEDFNTGYVFPGRYRNSRLGDFLKELDLTEGYATGIKVVPDALKANGSPEPSFYTNEGRTWFRVKVPIHEAFLREKQAGEETTQGGAKVSEKQYAVYLQLKDNPTLGYRGYSQQTEYQSIKYPKAPQCTKKQGNHHP